MFYNYDNGTLKKVINLISFLELALIMKTINYL